MADRLTQQYDYPLSRIRVEEPIVMGRDATKKADIVIIDADRPEALYAAESSQFTMPMGTLCSCEDLFGGLIITIYRMRNMLLHGELKPDPGALACYAPAYHLLRRMLKECR